MRVAEFYKFAISCAFNACAIVVVWGSLAALQLNDFTRAYRTRVWGTQNVEDFGWYAQDRMAVWEVGNQAPVLSGGIDILTRYDQVFPRLGDFAGREVWTSLAVLYAIVIVCSLIGALTGRWVVRKTFARYLNRKTWMSARASVCLWQVARIGTMAASVGTGFTWYTLFDRSADSVSPEEYLSVSRVAVICIAGLIFVFSALYAFRKYSQEMAALEQHGEDRNCMWCGYSLMGLTSVLCPECGADSGKVLIARLTPIWRTTVIILVAACMAVMMVQAVRHTGWHARSVLRWFAMGSCYFSPNPRVTQVRGLLLENQVAKIQSGNEVLLMQVSGTTSWVSEVRLRYSLLGSKQDQARAAWSTVVFSWNLKTKTYQPRTYKIAIDAIDCEVSPGAFTSGVGSLMPFVLSDAPDDYEVLQGWPGH